MTRPSPYPNLYPNSILLLLFFIVLGCFSCALRSLYLPYLYIIVWSKGTSTGSSPVDRTYRALRLGFFVLIYTDEQPTPLVRTPMCFLAKIQTKNISFSLDRHFKQVYPLFNFKANLRRRVVPPSQHGKGSR